MLREPGASMSLCANRHHGWPLVSADSDGEMAPLVEGPGTRTWGT